MRKSNILLLILILVGSNVISFLSVKANPYPIPIETVAPTNVKAPIIVIATPQEQATYLNGSIPVAFDVTAPSGSNLLSRYILWVDYKGDWMRESERVFSPEGALPQSFLKFNFNITGIPFGEQSLNITAYGRGTFGEDFYGLRRLYSFSLNGTSSVNFSVRTNPIITFPSTQNETFESSFLPLNFTVDHPVSKAAYSLDGKENIQISGNTTLTGLSNGQHNVTVYVTDELGDSTSETINFTVAVPFPTLTVVIVATVSATAVSAGAVVYFKKYQH